MVDYIDHAPVWQGPIFARGVFRPTQNGAPEKPLEIHWKSNFGETAAQFILRSPRALNVTDEAVYFHICQLVAAGRGVELGSEDPEYAACHDAIAAKGFGVGERMNAVSVTSSDLAAGIGLTRTGTNAKSMIESLSRLTQATIERKFLVEGRELRGTSRFLAFMVHDKNLRIVLHCESAKLAGKRSGVAWINMREHRSVGSKPGKRLHAWLSAWASDNQMKPVGWDSLLANVWGESPASPSIRKDRMRTLRKAIQEVAKLPGWSCVITTDGRQLLVQKPPFAGTTAQKIESSAMVVAAEQGAAVTPTAVAVTPTDSVGTPTKVAETPTADPPEAARSVDSEELVFAL